MTNECLAKLIAKGLIETGIEGAYSSVAETTNEEESYPSIGVSQWEGSRADELLSRISGGEKFIGMTYPEIILNDMLDELEELLDSPEGQEQQLQLLAEDCIEYVEEVQLEGLFNPQCIVYAGMWCPTSTYCVCNCISLAQRDGVNINNLEELSGYFYDRYAYVAGVEEYIDGYQNRSDNSYEYVEENVND